MESVPITNNVASSNTTPVSATNKSDRHDIAEILLKVALNTIILTPLTKVYYSLSIHLLLYSIRNYTKLIKKQFVLLTVWLTQMFMVLPTITQLQYYNSYWKPENCLIPKKNNMIFFNILFCTCKVGIVFFYIVLIGIFWKLQIISFLHLAWQSIFLAYKIWRQKIFFKSKDNPL